MLNILIAPSGFKESLDADQVARAIEDGVLRALPDAQVRRLPLVDGGEGFTRGVVEAMGGSIVPATVTGPTGQPVLSHFGLVPGRTADDGPTGIIEMAAAAGLRLVPAECRDPGRTTTRGVGELMLAAVQAGARRLLIGCGDSGTNDAGMGAGVALGVRFLDRDGNELAGFGSELGRLHRIDMSRVDRRFADIAVEVACNQHNVLCGPHGVARVFGPQKGATPAQVEELAAGLDRFAHVVRRDVGVDVTDGPGTGASGGLGAGLLAWCGATLTPRFDVVSRFVDLDAEIAAADLVITAEGSLDLQTPRGKIPAEVARRAAAAGVPAVALAGTLGRGARSNLDVGLLGYVGILPRPCSLDEAIESAAEWVGDGAEQLIRLAMVGRAMAAR
jgi:glycerate 2-kinase